MKTILKRWLNVLLMSILWLSRTNAQNNLIAQNDTAICRGETITLQVAAPPEAPELILLPPGSQFEYSLNPPPKTWNTTTGGWQLGNAPFGSDRSTLNPDFYYNTL